MPGAIAKKSRGLIFRQSVAAVLTVFLCLLPLILLAWVLEEGEPGSFLGVFSFVLSGQIFGQGWNPVHAGFSLDQPTIGKWLFWFTVFAAVSLSYMALIRKLVVRFSVLRNWMFSVVLTVLCLFLICLLTIPFWWLIQYISHMGWTGKRLCGLFYGIFGYTAVFVFWYKATLLTRKTLRSSAGRLPFIRCIRTDQSS